MIFDLTKRQGGESKPKVYHYTYIQDTKWTTDANGNTLNFCNTYFTNGGGYYRATVTNTLATSANYRATEAVMITSELLLSVDTTARVGRFYRKGGANNIRDSLATNISFYIGEGSQIDVYFIPYDEII